MRFFGPTIKRVAPGGERHIPRARTLLGVVARQMELGGLQQLIRRQRTGDGFLITAGIIFGIPFVEISGVVVSSELLFSRKGGFILRPAYSDEILSPFDNGWAWQAFTRSGTYRLGWRSPYEVDGEPYKEDGLNLGRAAIGGFLTEDLLVPNDEDSYERDTDLQGANIDWRSLNKEWTVNWSGPLGRTMYMFPREKYGAFILDSQEWGTRITVNGVVESGVPVSVFGACLWENSNARWIIAVGEVLTGGVDWPYLETAEYCCIRRQGATGSDLITFAELETKKQDYINAIGGPDEATKLAQFQIALNSWVYVDISFGEQIEYTLSVSAGVIYRKGTVQVDQTQPWFANGSATEAQTVRFVKDAAEDDTSWVCKIEFNASVIEAEIEGTTYLLPQLSPVISREKAGSVTVDSEAELQSEETYGNYVVKYFTYDHVEYPVNVSTSLSATWTQDREKQYEFVRGVDYIGDTEVRWVERFVGYLNVDQTINYEATEFPPSCFIDWTPPNFNQYYPGYTVNADVFHKVFGTGSANASEQVVHDLGGVTLTFETQNQSSGEYTNTGETCDPSGFWSIQKEFQHKTCVLNYVDLRYNFVHFSITENKTNVSVVNDVPTYGDKFETFKEYVIVGGSQQTIVEHTNPQTGGVFISSEDLGSAIGGVESSLTFLNQRYKLTYPFDSSQLDGLAVYAQQASGNESGWAVDNSGNYVVSCLVGADYFPKTLAGQDPPYIKDVYNFMTGNLSLPEQTQTVVPEGKYYTAHLNGQGIFFIGEKE